MEEAVICYISHYFSPSFEIVKDALSTPSGVESADFTHKGGVKDCIRTQLADNISLSVPLVGGNSILKHRHVDFSKLMISDHGNWQRKHLGAWQAIYGKTPFYPYIFPKLEEVYLHHSKGRFIDFTGATLQIALDFLNLDSLQSSAINMLNQHPHRFEQIKQELLLYVNPSLTIFDAIFRLGKSTALLLL